MKKSLLIFIGLVSLNCTYGQNTNAMPETSIKAAYMGSLIYPGFKIGIERPSKVIQVEKTKSWGTKTILKERYWTYNFGFYHHKTFHTNLFLLVERQMRRQNSGGFFVEFAPGLGYSRTFLDGITYTVNENGVVNKKSLAGYNYAMLSLGGGCGYDFSRKTKMPFKMYLKTSALIMAPYNSFLYVRPTAELGIIYSLKSFWKANPSVTIKKK